MKIFLITAFFIIPLIIGTSYAVPSVPPPFELGLELDKVLYKPGDTVMMHVWGDGTARANSTVYLKILDATSYVTGTTVIFQDAKNLVNNDIRFNYTVPMHPNTSNSPYRFLVQVYQNPDDLKPLNGVYFITRDGAQRLTIPTVTLTSVTKPGGIINFTARVTDGLGYVIPDIHVRGDLPQTDGTLDYLSSDTTYDNSTKLFAGSMQVPQNWSNYPQLNGTYYLRIIANPLYPGPAPMANDYSNKGIVPVENKTSTIQIVVESPCKNNPSNQFCLAKTSKITQYHLYNSDIKPGDAVQYDVQVVDKQGNPIGLEVDANLFYQASWGPSVSHGLGGLYDESQKVVHGEIGMPQDIPPGNYTIDLFFPGNNDMHKPDGQIPIVVFDVKHVPEFPLVSVVLLASIASVIIFYRFKIGIN